MAFSEFSTAARFRDLVRRIVRAELERVRPAYRHAVVQSVDLAARRVTVRYPGETEDVITPFGYAVPVAGQTVRIDGLRGDRHVVDIVGPF